VRIEYALAMGRFHTSTIAPSNRVRSAFVDSC
jgi:hypothetical protein